MSKSECNENKAKVIHSPVTQVNQDRMAPVVDVVAKIVQAVGNTANSHVRHIAIQSDSSACDNRRHEQSCTHGEKQPDMDVSTTGISSQGMSQVNASHEFYTSKFDSLDFGGLEGTGWIRLIKDLQPEDVELLQSAWRPSTWKTYSSAWKDWLKWCRSVGVIPDNPTPLEVARYLSYLFRVKKVSYSTILVRKSVITTFANPEGEHKIGNHPMIRSILKAISSKSAEKISPCPQIWNILDLINWLRMNPPDETSIYQISRHCALLLLLASGRRLHDLTLLQIDNKHCLIKEDSVTFWPVFGSKTDCVKQRQSGWMILKNPDSELDIIKLVGKLLKVSSDRRKAASNEQVSLFITTRGKVKPASRTVIAGWLKPVFNQLGLEVPPGSIRSAVASYNFENNLPLDDLLRRGNWRGATNFLKHYYKPVMAPSLHAQNVVLNSFVPI